MYLTGLARVARDAGITVREVPGWQTRTAHRGGMARVHGVIWHHTATPAASVIARNNPTTQYMTTGLGYPLANYGLAWDGSLDVIAAGTGAHAGKGSYRGVPNNDGNRHMIGVEVEGTIGLRWSDAQLETAARLGAQLNRDFGADLLHIGHYEWAPGRKTDPTGIPGMMPALRSAIHRGYWAAPTTISHASHTTPTPTTPLEDTLAKLDDDDIQNIKAAFRDVLTEQDKRGIELRDTTAWRIKDGAQQATTASRVLQEIHGLATEGARAAGATEQVIKSIIDRPREAENKEA
jgi:hypothetical protein